MRIDGSDITKIPLNDVQYWAVSPDGKSIAYSYLDPKSRKTRIFVVALNGGAPLYTFDAELDRSLQWLSDGSGLTYIDSEDRNIWVQSINGGPPEQLTHLQSDLGLVNFAWSRNGKELAYTRGTGMFDAVAISLK
jgi:Tol biopolymer transport system component